MKGEEGKKYQEKNKKKKKKKKEKEIRGELQDLEKEEKRTRIEEILQLQSCRYPRTRRVQWCQLWESFLCQSHLPGKKSKKKKKGKMRNEEGKTCVWCVVENTLMRIKPIRFLPTRLCL
jgi:hypothetical protein